METIKEVSPLSNITLTIVHPGLFHKDDVYYVALSRLLGNISKVERRNPTDEEINDPTILVGDVGLISDYSKNCHDHHQQGDFESAVLQLFSHYGSFILKLCNNDPNYLRLLDLFEYISDEDLGKTKIDKSKPAVDMFNNLSGAPDDKFDKAVKFATEELQYIIYSTNIDMTVMEEAIKVTNDMISNCKEIIKNSVLYGTSTVKCSIIPDSSGYPLGWQENAPESIKFIICYDERNKGYKIMSRDSRNFPIPEKVGMVYYDQRKFMAVYTSRTEAIDHFKEFVVNF